MHSFAALEMLRNSTAVLIAERYGVLGKDRVGGLWTPFPTKISQPPALWYHLDGVVGRLSSGYWPVATLMRCLSRLAVALSDQGASAPTNRKASLWKIAKLLTYGGNLWGNRE
jgi:hypothetical protein